MSRVPARQAGSGRSRFHWISPFATRSAIASALMLASAASTLAAQGSAKAPPAKPAAAKPAAAKPHETNKPMDTSLHGTWRVSRGVIAPWVAEKDKKSWNTKEWIGQTVRFEPNKITGPKVLQCSGVVNYEATTYPADALFQGGLPSPASKATTMAKNLGFSKLPAKGTSLNCDAGLFEFHQLDANAEVVAVNNVIWTLDRSPGALADAASPGGVVQRFLEGHFAGNMGFDSTTFLAKRQYLSAGLISAARKYFAKPVPKGDAPDIDGDPFTDSQEYPTRFSVGAAAVTGNTAKIPVKFSDAFVTKTITYSMAMENGTWRIDDLRYEGGTLRALFAGSSK